MTLHEFRPPSGPMPWEKHKKFRLWWFELSADKYVVMFLGKYSREWTAGTITHAERGRMKAGWRIMSTNVFRQGDNVDELSRWVLDNLGLMAGRKPKFTMVRTMS